MYVISKCFHIYTFGLRKSTLRKHNKITSCFKIRVANNEDLNLEFLNVWFSNVFISCFSKRISSFWITYVATPPPELLNSRIIISFTTISAHWLAGKKQNIHYGPQRNESDIHLWWNVDCMRKKDGSWTRTDKKIADLVALHLGRTFQVNEIQSNITPLEAPPDPGDIKHMSPREVIELIDVLELRKMPGPDSISLPYHVPVYHSHMSYATFSMCRKKLKW